VRGETYIVDCSLFKSLSFSHLSQQLAEQMERNLAKLFRPEDSIITYCIAELESMPELLSSLCTVKPDNEIKFLSS